MMTLVLGALFLAAFTAIARAFGFEPKGLLVAELALLALAGIIVGVHMYQVRQHLLIPLAQLYGWALKMCDGDFSARIVAPREGRFAKLSFHVNRLSEALDRLANARKHSRAKLVRVLLQRRGDGGYRLLIEDDGLGFDESAQQTGAGEDIGLSIMRDRAPRLGGELKIESEPGEGTRLDLMFDTTDPAGPETLSQVGQAAPR